MKLRNAGVHPPAVGRYSVDCSESIRWRHRQLVDLATTFLESSSSSDEISLVIFNEHPFLCLATNHRGPNNLKLLEEAIREFPAEGETALYDVTIEQIKRGTRQRRALVIISGGDDRIWNVWDPRQCLSRASNSSIAMAFAYLLGLFPSSALVKEMATLQRDRALVFGCVDA